MNSFRLSSKHNRSTANVALRNNFLSSASEDDEDTGQAGSKRKAMRRAAVKGVALAAMHSSVNNGRRQDSGLPLYG